MSLERQKNIGKLERNVTKELIKPLDKLVDRSTKLSSEASKQGLSTQSGHLKRASKNYKKARVNASRVLAANTLPPKLFKTLREYVTDDFTTSGYKFDEEGAFSFTLNTRGDVKGLVKHLTRRGFGGEGNIFLRGERGKYKVSNLKVS